MTIHDKYWPKIHDGSRAVCPTCGHCRLADAGALLALLQEAGVITVDAAGILTMTPGAQAMDGDALDALIADLGRGDLTAAELRAIVERGAPN